MAGRRLARSNRRRGAGLPVAAFAAILVAEAAVWLLGPGRAKKPATVPASDYFTSAELARARDFARGQRLLGLAALAVEAGLLAQLALRPPRGALRRADRVAGGRPPVAGAIVGAGLAVLAQVAPLPLRALARRRAVHVGLVTQGWRGWAYDLSRMIAIGAMLSGAGAALLLSLMKRFPRRWWLGAAVGATASEVLAVWLAPVVLAPLFNRYRELPPGGVRSDLLELARRAGVEVGQVLVVDASRRTTATNAYVTGLGRTKRVVLYDTLLEQFDPSEVRLVVAHELAHVKSRDVQRALLWAALVGPAGMLVIALLTERLAAHAGTRPGAPGSLPAFALAAALVGFVGSAASNRLSRRVEERADEFALDLAGEPRRFIEMERRLAVSNVADPDPPRALQWLFATHPPVINRIGAAVAHERQQLGD